MKITQLRTLSAAVILGALGLAPLARAGEMAAYDDAAYRSAVNEGKTVVLAFHADWCGTCKKQALSMTEALKDEAFADVVTFKVNFDDAKALKKEFGVKQQSTIVVFKGGKEVARDIGETSVDGLRALISKGT